MRLPDKFLLYLLCVSLLALFTSFRFSWSEVEKIPRDEEVVVVFTLSKEPKITGQFQIVEVGDGRVFASLFPRYRVGDRLKIEGMVDEKGRVFNAKVEKIGHEQGFFK